LVGISLLLIRSQNEKEKTIKGKKKGQETGVRTEANLREESGWQKDNEEKARSGHEDPRRIRLTSLSRKGCLGSKRNARRVLV